jgi:hypothetical protein
MYFLFLLLLCEDLPLPGLAAVFLCLLHPLLCFPSHFLLHPFAVAFWFGFLFLGLFLTPISLSLCLSLRSLSPHHQLHSLSIGIIIG